MLMEMAVRLLRVLIVVLAFESPSLSAAELQPFPGWDEPFPFLGIGNKPCRNWTEAREHDGKERDAYNSWLWGFYSGYNAFYQGPKSLFGNYDEPHVADAIDRYCLKFPDQIIAKVALQFLEDLRRGEEIYKNKPK